MGREKARMKKYLGKRKNVREVENDLFIVGSPKFPNSNSVVIVDDDKVLLDTGSRRKVLEGLAGDVDIVINSHYHFDHNLWNKLFDKIWINEIEAPAIEGSEKYLKMSGVSDPRIGGEIKGSLLRESIWSKEVGSIPLEGVLDFGDTSWKIIHAPGHSPGHCCFYEEDLDVLFAGDYGPEEFGPWYGYPSCSLTDSIRSIRKIIDLDPGTILSGHADPLWSDAVPRMNDYLDKIKKRDRIISDLHENGKGVEEILNEDIFYSGEAKSIPILEFFARTMISKHLEENIG